MHDTFSNVGILFIDDKRMFGQKIFNLVSKRLQEAHPHYKNEKFGYLSVILLGFNKLPPVCDYPLAKANGVNPSRCNI